MLASLRTRGRAFFFAPADARPLALFRIVLGIMLLVEAVMIYPALSDLYGPRGFLDATLMRAVSGRNLPAYAGLFEGLGIPYLSLLWAVFGVRMAAIFFFLVGFFTGPAGAVLWLTQTFLMASGPLSSYGLDRYFHLFLFIIMFFPAGAAFSFDARRGRVSTAPSWRSRLGLRLLQLALLITYLNAGVAKAVGPEWWTGDAIWRALHLPEFRQAEFWWMGDHPWVPQLLAIGTLVIETFYILGVWVPYLGALWVLGIVGLHVGIMLLMNLANFGLGMALFNTALFLYPKGRVWLRRTRPRRFLVGLAGTLAPGATARFAQTLFRRTRRYPRPAWEAELAGRGTRLEPLPGISALRFGEGPRAVLLLHGWGGRGTQMGAFVEPLLQAGFRVVTFDGPGHGESAGAETDLGDYVRVVAALAEKEGPFAGAVAHSFGAVAVMVAAARGVPIGRLVLIGAPSQLEGSLQTFARELGLSGRAFGIFKKETEARAGLAIADTNIGELGRAAGKPGLLIHDVADDIVPFAQAEATLSRWPAARLHAVHGLGHRRILKDPGVAKLTVGFLTKLAPLSVPDSGRP